MTIVEGARPPISRAGGWLDSTDHRVVGRIYIYAALLFLVVGGIAGFALRADLATAGSNLGSEYGQVFSMHATVLPVLFLAPLWVGIATCLVPAQIGANRLAFPRLHATSFWLFVAGGELLLVAYALDGFSVPGLTTSSPLTAAGGTSTANELWVVGVAMVTVSALAAAIGLVATIALLRAPGLTFGRLPHFTWSVFLASTITLISAPVLLAGLLLVWLDQHFAGVFFAAKGSGVVWQHTIWLFGRPDGWLLLLPALGAATDLVETHARRPLLGRENAPAALGVFALLSLSAWASGTRAADAIVVPAFSPSTALIAVPVGLLVLMWLGTLATGKPRGHVSLVFVAIAAALGGLAVTNAAIAAVVGVTGSAWTTGFLHAGLFGPSLLLGVAALHHWAPRFWGRPLPAAPGAIAALLLGGGFLLDAGGSFILGYQGASRYTGDLGSSGAAKVAAAGAVVAALGVLTLIVAVVRTARAGPDHEVVANPYDGSTLEWAAAPISAQRNFDDVVRVKSAQPLADLREPAEVTGG